MFKEKISIFKMMVKDLVDLGLTVDLEKISQYFYGCLNLYNFPEKNILTFMMTKQTLKAIKLCFKMRLRTDCYIFLFYKIQIIDTIIFHRYWFNYAQRYIYIYITNNKVSSTIYATKG